ncbi:MAG: sugar ABC transporter permease [Candidatus Tectomicrobia bacterium]|uniref:Sugar ABC transporter permease n=1 Tax=Tectimicrobiota bacterium TaxID=2528274 RepID=A0A937W7W1_UNCTE|nr:sugar ABC transporter permease [Candidatus Tectomicrobia bacterium]
MATYSTTGVSIPSSQPVGWRMSRLQRFLLRDSTLGYLFLFPALFVILGLVAYPFVNAIIMTFQAKTAGAPGRFIGLANYAELLGNPVFWRVIFNTLIYTAFGVGLKFFFGLGMALVLNQERRWNNMFRSFLLIPWAIPTVISALNWRWIYDDASGLINNVLVRLELVDETISWLSDPHLAMLAVIVVVVWQGTPFFTMSFLAGLQAIPKELYEAAEIDGASVMQQFFYITIPRLQPIFITAIMLSAILTSASVQFVYILTNGGPADRTQIFPTMAYNLALGGAQRLGMGATVSLFFFPILVIFIIFLTRRMLREKGE